MISKVISKGNKNMKAEIKILVGENDKDHIYYRQNLFEPCTQLTYTQRIQKIRNILYDEKNEKNEKNKLIMFIIDDKNSDPKEQIEKIRELLK